MTAGVNSGVFPGAVLLVFQGDRIEFLETYGISDLFEGTPATSETVFDLASLTKPLATTVALITLAEAGLLDPNQPISESGCLDRESVPWGSVTFAHLLTHCGGFRAHYPFFMHLPLFPVPDSRRILRSCLAKETLEYNPGSACVYSDIGFMVLEWLVETKTGRRMDEFLQDRIYGPLEIGLFFNPLEKPIRPASYAATEWCPRRNILLKGRVHDDNAWAAGGVSGHAGLFGRAMDVFLLLKHLLLDLCGLSKDPFFQRRILKQWLQRAPGEQRAYGFDMPGNEYASCGRYFSPRSIGHLGFTGTSFWMDPETGTGVVLLTNRVHPSRYSSHRPPLIRAFRPELHDTIMRAMGFDSAYRPVMVP